MSRRIILAGILAIWAAPPVLGQQIPFSKQLMPSRTALGRIGLEPNWFNTIPLSANERAIQVSITEGFVFVQTNSSNFHAYDAESGRYLWMANLGPPSMVARPASINKTAVFVTRGSQLYSLDRRTGRTLWTKKLEASATCATAAGDDRVLVATAGNNNTDLGTGRLTSIPLGNEHATPLIWSTNGIIRSRPLAAGPVNAFGSMDARLYVVRIEPPRIVYRFLTGGPITAPLATYGTRTVLVASGDHNLYAIDLYTGRKYWSWTTGAPIDQEPLVGNEDVYAMNTDGLMGAVEIKTGKILWTLPTGGGRLLSVGTKRVYLETHDRDLFIVDRKSGTMVADAASIRARGLDVREFTLTPTNHLNGRIYLVSPSGMLVCLREIGQTRPVALRDPNLPAFGYLPPQQATRKPAAPAEETPAVDETEPEKPKAKAAPKPKADEEAMPEPGGTPEGQEAPK